MKRSKNAWVLYSETTGEFAIYPTCGKSVWYTEELCRATIFDTKRAASSTAKQRWNKNPLGGPSFIGFRPVRVGIIERKVKRGK